MAARSSTTNDSGPHPVAVMLAVGMTVIAGFVLFLAELGVAMASYRSEHQLPRVRVGFWIFSRYEPAPVTLVQLGVEVVAALAVVALLYATILHPIIGRIVAAVAQSLAKQVASVYQLRDRMTNWEPESSILFRAAWPVTIVSIPLLLIALMSGIVYKTLWR